MGATPNILVVPPSLPVKSVKEFIAHVKANPGKLNYGGQGIGQSGHLSMKNAPAPAVDAPAAH